MSITNDQNGCKPYNKYKQAKNLGCPVYLLFYPGAIYSKAIFHAAGLNALHLLTEIMLTK